jgi:uncharacterized protein YaiL (DUF2058 family)
MSMQNLRDKLLQAGLVDEKKKKQADHQARQQRSQKKKKNKARGRRPDAAEAERARVFAEREAERRRADRERERRRHRERQAQAAAAEQRRAEHEAAERAAQRELVERYRLRELVQASLFLPARPGPVPFHFVSRSGAIRRLDLTTRIAHELEQGMLAIAQLPGRERWGLLRRDVAERVREREPALLRFYTGGSDAELAPEPPAPKPPRTGRLRQSGRFGQPQPSGGDRRRER